MNGEQRYRNTLRGRTPSPAWRESTLAAMKAAQGRRRPPRPLAFAAAAALALAVTGGLWWSGRMSAGPDGPGVARTPEPVATPAPTVPDGSLDSFSVVTDPSQLMGNNPTAGRLDELTELPVYENPIPTEAEQRTLLDQWAEALGLTITDTQWFEGTGEETMDREPKLKADCADGTRLRLIGLNTLMIYDSPDLEALEEAALAQLALIARSTNKTPSSSGLPGTAQETLTTCSYAGEGRTARVTYLTRPGAPLEEQVYAYSFQRVEATDTQLTIYLPPASSAAAFPLRPVEDAVASFRAGDSWGGHYTAHPERADILQITLAYDISQGQPYLQPVYCIFFTLDYWDGLLTDEMFYGLDPDAYMGVGVVYVPAIDPDYQDEAPYRHYFNDGLAHHLPDEPN